MELVDDGADQSLSGHCNVDVAFLRSVTREMRVLRTGPSAVPGDFFGNGETCGYDAGVADADLDRNDAGSVCFGESSL